MIIMHPKAARSKKHSSEIQSRRNIPAYSTCSHKANIDLKRSMGQVDFRQKQTSTIRMIQMQWQKQLPKHSTFNILVSAAVEIWKGTRLLVWRQLLQRYVLLHKVPVIDQLQKGNSKLQPGVPIASYSKAVPSRTIWRRALMPRQPYSVAVLSTGGRFSSSSLRGEDRDERWSLL